MNNNNNNRPLAETQRSLTGFFVPCARSHSVRRAISDPPIKQLLVSRASLKLITHFDETRAINRARVPYSLARSNCKL